MRKAKVTVPAVSANLGPGVGCLGLALALHITVLFSERSDTRLVIDSEGEDSADLPVDCLNPVMYAAIRVFQRLEDAPLGLNIHIRNTVPLDAGLGARAALTVAGLVGANNLMNNPLSRDELIALGTEIMGKPGEVIPAMLGGLTITSVGGGEMLYRRLETVPFKVIVIAPEIERYAEEKMYLPEIVDLDDTAFNLGRLVLLVEALRNGEFDLMARALEDRLLWPHLRERIPALSRVAEVAIRSGALAVTISGEGPSLLAFALVNHRKIAANMEAAFRAEGLISRSWVLSADTQGVVISAAETLG